MNAMSDRRQAHDDGGETPGRLQSGRNGLAREHPDGHRQVSDIQRARMLAATVIGCGASFTNPAGDVQ
jgi:hypothetical protein